MARNGRDFYRRRVVQNECSSINFVLHQTKDRNQTIRRIRSDRSDRIVRRYQTFQTIRSDIIRLSDDYQIGYQTIRSDNQTNQIGLRSLEHIRWRTLSAKKLSSGHILIREYLVKEYSGIFSEYYSMLAEYHIPVYFSLYML